MFTLKLENAKQHEVNLHDGKKYLILNAEGLNPPSASLFINKSPNRKGGKYNGSTLSERHVRLTIKLLGDIEANRNALYEWIDTESYVKILYTNGVKSVYCEGHVEECEINLFTDNEVIDLAITCEDPYWKELNEIAIEISSLLKQFVFPFAIDQAGIPFSTIRESNSTNIFNEGAETGMQLKVKCNGTVEKLRIWNPKDTTQQFQINRTLEKNWTIVIDTESSPKTVKLYKPDNTVENLLKNVAPNPTWFTLKSGNNTFGYGADKGLDEVELTITFSNKHLGV